MYLPVWKFHPQTVQSYAELVQAKSVIWTGSNSAQDSAGGGGSNSNCRCDPSTPHLQMQTFPYTRGYPYPSSSNNSSET